ncbi:MAG: hypothetical protein BGO25_17510 [Acidobacteriales bacterium 59-55]|nr:EscU/YscU/HrcU family type III secretion system export apparatus switch protein [Terriglobales bacterium]OJV41489.1 MAG: hypothetical protein BGO25_17510 [Acidobacteriales bacterium 59-55]
MSEKGTEQATPQRRKKAKEKGDSVHSRELLSAMAMLGGVLALGAMAHGFVSSWDQVYVESLRTATVAEVNDERGWNEAIRKMLEPAILPVGLVLAASFAGVLAAGVAQVGGVEIHPSAIEPKFSKLNPVTNAGHLFGLQAVSRSKEAQLRMKELLGQSKIGALLQFPQMRLRASEIAALTPGTVLRLPLPNTRPAELRLGGLRFGEANPVRIGEHRGAQLYHAMNYATNHATTLEQQEKHAVPPLSTSEEPIPLSVN